MDTSNLMRVLKKKFLSCVPLKSLLSIFDEDNNVNLDFEAQKIILNTTVNNPLVKKYPLKVSYQKSFLKHFIEKLEQRGQEITGELYDAYCSFLSSKECEAQKHFRHFALNNQDNPEYITIEESTSIISQGTTGLCSWQAASVLAEWCIENKSRFEEKIVLELGSGVGLLGLAVIKKCSPKRYIFSDGHPKVLEILRSNIIMNCRKEGSSPLDEDLDLSFVYGNTDVQIMSLLWAEIDEWTRRSGVKPEVILAADILFDSSVFWDLASGLKSLLSLSDNYSIFAVSVRNEATFFQFLNDLDDNNVHYEDEVTPEENVFVRWSDIPIRLIELTFN